MRKIAPVLLGLGAFLLVAGLVALLWAPGVVKKTPLEVDSVTRLSGEAARIDTATGELGEAQPVVATSITKSDSDASTDSYVVMTSTQCLVVDEGDPGDCVDGSDERLVNASTDVFATDRVTAEAVNDVDGLPADAEPHEGLVNKWPFDPEQKTYPYWDGTAGTAVDADFDRTESVDGLEVNVYKVEVSDAPIEIAEGTPGTYDDTKELWVDQVTGALIHQIDDQQRYLEDGTQAFDLQLSFTDDQVAANVADAQDNISSLRLVTVWIPVIGIGGGVLLLLAGLVGLVRGNRQQPPTGTRAHERDPQSV